MSEKRYTPSGVGDNGDAAQIDKHRKNVDPDELLDDLADKWDAMTERDFDSGKIDKHLKALDISAHLNIDTEASLAAFREKHANLFNQIEPINSHSGTQQVFRIRKRYRFLRFIAAIVIVMLGCMITAQALGFDVFGMIARWSDEAFHFSSTKKETGQTGNPIESSYSSLQDALKAYGMPVLIAPDWFPSGFHFKNVKVTPTPTSVRFQAAYINDDKFLTVTIWQMASVEDANSRIIEKDNPEVMIYDHNYTRHYIMSNNSQITAAWTKNNLMSTFSGDISKDDAKKMIDSIYER